MPSVFIGIGSNIEPEKNLEKTAMLLRKIWSDVHFSPVFKTAPIGFADQPVFLNAAARFETDELPKDVLKKLQMIEHTLKKSPPFRFGPRTIDIDLLLYGEEVLPSRQEWDKGPIRQAQGRRRTEDPFGRLRAGAGQRLFVPHVRMHQRRFVLEPLCELIDANTLHPVFQVSWKKLLQGTLNQGCEKTTIPLTHAASRPPQRRRRGEQ